MERSVLASLGGLTQGSALTLGGWADRVELPLMSAVVFGPTGPP